MSDGRRHLRVPRSVLGFGLLAIAVACVLTFTASRAVTPPPSRPAAPKSAAQAPRPPVTPAEESYIRAMWPIHGDVERGLMRASLGQILYKTQDVSRAELQHRMEQALAVYRSAESRLRELHPPPSLQPEHEQYLAAVRLFQEAAVEANKMFADGREDHLLAAYPKSQEGSDKIREVGGKFWPNEFPPN
jgi:hypothetical protein